MSCGEKDSIFFKDERESVTGGRCGLNSETTSLHSPGRLEI